MHNDRVVLDEAAGRAEEDNPTVRRIGDGVVSDDAVGTTETDTVSPFLERVRATWTDVVVLNNYARAGERPFGDVQTRPRAGIKRVNVFDLKTISLRSTSQKFGKFANQLSRVASSHLNVGASLSGRGARPGPVDL